MSGKVAFAIGADGAALEHFGHTERFAVYEFGQEKPVQREIRDAAAFCGHEGKEVKLRDVADLLSDCRAVICAAIGPCARLELSYADIEAFEFDGTVDAAVQIIARRPLFGQRVEQSKPVREISK